MKRRELTSLALVILGMYFVLQGITSFGILIGRTDWGRIFLFDSMGHLSFRDPIWNLGLPLLDNLIFGILPGILAICYRNRIVHFIYPSTLDRKLRAIAFNTEDLLRVGLILIGIGVFYSGLVDLSFISIYPFIQTEGARVLIYSPLVPGLVKIIMGYILVLRTTTIMKLINKAGGRKSSEKDFSESIDQMNEKPGDPSENK